MSKGSKEKQETLTSVESKGRDPKLSCNFCLEKQDKESLNQTGLSACPKQHVSPTSSLTSSDSTVSCCSKVSTIPIIILIRLQLCNFSSIFINCASMLLTFWAFQVIFQLRHTQMAGIRPNSFPKEGTIQKYRFVGTYQEKLGIYQLIFSDISFTCAFYILTGVITMVIAQTAAVRIPTLGQMAIYKT